MLRVIRELLIIAVFAGALTALVLGHPGVGACLAVLGAVMVSLAARGHRVMSFGGLLR